MPSLTVLAAKVSLFNSPAKWLEIVLVLLLVVVLDEGEVGQPRPS
jgi:hypothetical protein